MTKLTFVPRTAVQEHKHLMQSSSWRILLVDDDHDDYILARAMLSETRQERFDLEWVSSYSQGLEALRTGSYDAVLMDYELGSRTGVDLIREVRAEGCSIPILLLTGRGTYEVDIEAMQAGASDFLNKNEINPAILERAIRYAMERQYCAQALTSANEELASVNKALNASRQQVYQILESISDCLFVLDSQWRIVYINSRAAHSSGQTTEVLAGRSIWEVFPSLVYTELKQGCIQAMETRQPAYLELYGLLDSDHRYEVQVYPIPQGIAVTWVVKTEQKKEEEELHRERELLQKLFERIPVMITIKPPGQTGALVNNEFTHLTGWTNEDTRNQDLVQLCYPNPGYQAQVRALMESIEESWSDFFVSTRGGDLLESSWTSFHLSDETLVSIGIDIRERKLAEQALMEANAQLRQQKVELETKNQQLETLFQNAPAGMALFEAHSPYRVLAHNFLYQQYFSEPYRTSGMLGLALADFSPGVVENGMSTIFDQVVETGIPQTRYAFPFRELPDRRTWWNWNVSPVVVGNRVIALAHMVVEVTEEIQARQRIETERAFLRSVLDQMPSGVVIAEAPHGRITYSNQQAEQIWRRSFVGADTVESGHEFEGFHQDGTPYQPDEWPRARALYKGAFVRDEEVTIRRGDGSLGIILVNATPVHDADDSIIASAEVFVDITERKRAERDTRFLINLGEILHHAPDASTMLDEVAENTGKHLDTAHCCFFETDPAGEVLLIHKGYHSIQPAPLAEHRATHCGQDALEELRFGRIVVNRDTHSKPRTADPSAKGGWPNELRACIAIPLMRDGIWTAAMMISDRRSRNWNDRQIAFLQTVAERTWAAYETRRLLVALRENEERAYRLAEDARTNLQKLETVVDSMSEAVMLSDAQGNIYRSNPSAVSLFGFANEAAMQISFCALREIFEASTANGQSISYENWPNNRALHGETIINLEVHMHRKDTGKRWIGLYSAIPVQNIHGEILLILHTITDITQVRRTEQQRREMVTRLQVQHLLVEQREQERLQIARNLHDGPIQDLIGLLFSLKTARSLAKEGELSEILQNIHVAGEQLVGQLRGVCNELRPPVLVRFGLAKAIQAHVEELLSRGSGLQVQLDLVDDTMRLSDDVRLALYRIYQESLNNVLRHARASQVSVRLEITPSLVTLEIQDNGQGFILPDDWLSLAHQGHLGLVGIKERAEAIGGSVELSSAPSQGTLVRVILPVAE